MAGLLVHEWVSRAGGSERVLDSLSELYPDADMFCLWNDAPDRYAPGRLRESVLARTPLRGRKALSLPAMPMVWRGVDARAYDWVLASSHAFSHQVATRSGLPPERHFSYVHTPARYIWTPELDGRGDSRAARMLARPLQRVDRRRAADHRNVAANSAYIRDRIRSTWGVDSVVIHPPVEVAALQDVDSWTAQLTDADHAVLDALPETFVLGASRFIPYKRLELVIAAGEAAGLPVVLAGGGTEEGVLRERAAVASVPVTFVLDPADALLRAVMARAAVYVFPPVEDFGIMPVEAMALGTPVVVGAIGGAVESVVDGITGAVLRGEDRASLAAAVAACLTLDAEACGARAREFGVDRFGARIREWMDV